MAAPGIAKRGQLAIAVVANCFIPVRVTKTVRGWITEAKDREGLVYRWTDSSYGGRGGFDGAGTRMSTPFQAKKMINILCEVYESRAVLGKTILELAKHFGEADSLPERQKEIAKRQYGVSI